ncbi:MAG: hypothetical protein Dbin4_01513 [Alphaproteobacteria bacterium]|nr:hypothetical protein [Alphaproteobacteria bacterium]
MIKQTQARFLAIAAIAIIAGIAGYYLMNAPDRRSTGEKIGDAVDELDRGLGEAAEKLEDRTPAEKLGDAIEDAGDDIKKSTGQEQ